MWDCWRFALSGPDGGFVFEELATHFQRLLNCEGDDECWPHRNGFTIAGKKRSNSPPFRIGKRQPPSAQIALWLAVGPAPEGKPIAIHTVCDYTPCCNPAHLKWGTTAENQAEKKAKGRSAKGDRNGARLYPERLTRGDANQATKIADADVAEIRRLAVSGEWKQLPEFTGDGRSGPHSVIGRHYGVSHTAIRNIVLRRTKRHVS